MLQPTCILPFQTYSCQTCLLWNQISKSLHILSCKPMTPILIHPGRLIYSCCLATMMTPFWIMFLYSHLVTHLLLIKSVKYCTVFLVWLLKQLLCILSISASPSLVSLTDNKLWVCFSWIPFAKLNACFQWHPINGNHKWIMKKCSCNYVTLKILKQERKCLWN